ncbi:MAG: ABC transporter ATP-binding protein [Chloroflexota bacterium]
MTPRLEARHISKCFTNLVANDHIDFALEPGEIHGLLGENGAGKTTFVNILSGMYAADEGEILIDGERVTIRSPRDAIQAGVGMVHQHFMLIPAFSIAENIRLGLVPTPRTWLSSAQHSNREIERFTKLHGLGVPVTRRVSDLSLGQQQRIEIVKALYWGSRILILDEPTAVLTPDETTQLAEHMRSMARDGQSIIFISHKLEEIKLFCHRVTVLRHGRVVATRATQDVEVGDLARLIVGRDLGTPAQLQKQIPGPAVLEVEQLTVLDDRGHHAVRDVTMSVRSGEILGVAGIDGNGQEELVEALYGIRSPVHGRVRLLGEDISRVSVMERQKLGLRNVPADRRDEGLILDFSIWENLALEESTAGEHRSFLQHTGVLQERARELTRTFRIRTPSVTAKVRQLSGGNQQKVVLARVLSAAPKVLIAAQPCRGLDIGATEYIRQRLFEERARGTAVMLISADLDEVLTLSDRMVVMFRGELVGIVGREQADRERLGRLMTGMTADG